MRRLFLLGCFLSLACNPGEETITIDLDPVDAAAANQIIINNNTGNITIEGEANRTEVDVQVTLRGGVQADFDQVTTLSALDGTAVNVTIEVPSNLPNVIGDVKVLVPNDLSTTLNAAVGDLSASGLISGAFLNSSGGDISCVDVNGNINVNTLTGNVVINTALLQGDEINVTTENQGNIELTLPANTDADLIAVSGGGNIAIGAGFNFVGTNENGSADGTLNAGGNGQTSIDLFTQTGEIVLLAQ